MFIISSRANFSNPDHLLLSVHKFREIDLLTDQTVRRFSDLNEFKAELVNKRVLILVHGYNNEQDEVYDAYEIIENKVRQHLHSSYDLVVGYSWPGGDSALEWQPSKRRANAVARRFRFLVEDLIQEVASLDIMSHSLGARVVLKALKESNVSNVVRNYYCTAAAVDNEVLEDREEFNASLMNIQNLYVFHSKRDGVLAFGYRVAEFDNALGLYGPEDKDYIQNETHNVFVANCKKKIKSHGAYKRSDDMYQYIASAMAQAPNKFQTL